MGIIIALIAVSVSLALIFLVVFLLSVRSGQYDDMHTPSVRILMENKTKQQQSNAHGIE